METKNKEAKVLHKRTLASLFFKFFKCYFNLTACICAFTHSSAALKA